MKKQVVFVAYAQGRSGTSALMGLLNKMGLYIPKSFKDIRNPKGYFEDPKYHNLIKSELSLFSNKYPPKPPSVADAELQIKEKLSLFKNYIDSHLKNSDNIALKTPRYFGILLANILKEEYDFYIILTERNIDQQANSISRMHEKSNNSSDEKLKINEIKELINRWSEFGTNLVKTYPDLNYHTTSFENIINEKYNSAIKLADFIGIPHPDKNTVEDWLDDKLVNRKKYKQTFLQKLKFKFSNLMETSRKIFTGSTKS